MKILKKLENLFVVLETDIGNFRVDKLGNVEIDTENQYGAWEYRYVDISDTEFMNQYLLTVEGVAELSNIGRNL